MESLKDWINIPDSCVAVFLLLGLFGGIRRGLSGELLRIVTIILALVLGWKGTNMGAKWLAARSDWSEQDLKVASFIGIFLIGYLFFSMIRHTLNALLAFAFKGKIEILGGALLGIGRACVFSTLAILAAWLIPSDPVQQALEQSHSGNLVHEHVMPLYEQWAGEHPDLNVPAPGKVLENGDKQSPDFPAWDEYIGPLIEPEDKP